MMYKFLILKRCIESVMMYPFILIGRIAGKFSKHKEFDIYFFFPFHHVGGAEKVHYQVAQTFAGKNAVIYFTRKSKKESFFEEFKKTGFVIRDISKFTDNKLIYPMSFIFRGIVSYRINCQKVRPIVFNGQSNFGYKISPWISPFVPQVDLIHALCSFSKIRIPFLRFYRKSVTVSKEIIQKHEELYKKYSMPTAIIDNIQAINYGIELPKRVDKEIRKEGLNVLYVGRGSEEKRIHLIALIAREISVIDTTIKFNFLGDVRKFIPEDLLQYCTLLGSITNSEEVDDIYKKNDVLLVTSSTESGPLVALEAMLRGLTVIATPVGIINEHISNEKK
ncbi:MAG: glycosyltransferase family 4 protein [Flavisolibacter sp.]|nr:glycosyltransferase family 4 protein [Flavisolibacter sp.]